MIRNYRVGFSYKELALTLAFSLLIAVDAVNVTLFIFFHLFGDRGVPWGVLCRASSRLGCHRVLVAVLRTVVVVLSITLLSCALVALCCVLCLHVY